MFGNADALTVPSAKLLNLLFDAYPLISQITT